MSEEQKIKRNRNLFIILLLFIFSILVFVSTDPSQNQETYTSCKKKADNFIANSEKEIIEGVKLGVLNKDDTYQTREQAEQKYFENIVLCNDLDAQQAMSARTHWGLFFGLWGLLAIVATLWQTQKAARAASDTLDIARIASQLEQRAYVDVESTIYGSSIGGNIRQKSFQPELDAEGMTKINFTIRVRNTGSMPARDIIILKRGRAVHMNGGVNGGYGAFETHRIGYLGPNSTQDHIASTNCPVWGNPTPNENFQQRCVATFEFETIVFFQDEFGVLTEQQMRGVLQRWVGISVYNMNLTPTHSNMVNAENHQDNIN